MAPALRITEFTDPGCPWAWAAEPVRQRIDWLYGDAIEWRLRMVGLAETPEEYEEKGYTPESFARAMTDIAAAHRMPLATHVPPRLAATVPACRAVVAARLAAGEATARRLLRALRLRHAQGGLLDDPEVIEGAAQAVGIGAERLWAWVDRPDVDPALRVDMAAAREPIAAAQVLEHKLARWPGGMRYTCPSYEVIRLSDGRRVAIPGFQPFAAYDVVLANLVPEVERREPPESVEEVLAWAEEPSREPLGVATAEVAEVMGIAFDEARAQLGHVAVEQHLGRDGLWSLPRYSTDSIAGSSDPASGTTTSAPASSSAE